MREQPITKLLDAVRAGEDAAADTLFSAVYAELRRLARSHRRKWHGNRTMNTTALISEAYLKLAGNNRPSWQNRTHFYATASRAMRQILINYAEKATALKRGGAADDLPLDEVAVMSESTAEDLLSLTQCLSQLEEDSPRRCRIVECRVFGGMNVAETAEALAISPATVKREWKIAAAVLKRTMVQGVLSDTPDNDPGEP